MAMTTKSSTNVKPRLKNLFVLTASFMAKLLQAGYKFEPPRTDT
jgi:hypothetical protein